MNTKHTQLTWVIGTIFDPYDIAIRKPNGERLTVAYCLPGNDRELKAKFIVRACNYYDNNQRTIKELMAALESILVWDDGNLPGDLIFAAQRTYDKVKADGEHHEIT